MATEAGLLGTPSVYLSSLVGTMGNYEELSRYSLVEAYRDGVTGVRRVIELMDDLLAKSDRQRASQWMLREIVDVTAFLVQTVESCAQG